MSIAKLPNLGERSAEMLAAAGITTCSHLRQLGPVRAFLAVKQTGARPSLNLLWALAGALSNQHWLHLSAELKAKLQQELIDLDYSL